MAKPTWHPRILEAIREMHSNHGFRMLRPCVVYYFLDGNRVARYKPDAILLRKRRGIHAVVIEAETASSAKVIPGDIALASMIRSSFAHMYPYKEIGIGREFRGTVPLRDIYDARIHYNWVEGDDRLHLQGNQIGKLGFILIVPDQESRKYYERYLDVFLKRQAGKTRIFDHARCVACDVPGMRAAKSSIGKILSRI